MAFEIVWTDEAKEDVRTTTAYLLDRFGDATADRFTDELAAALRRLEAMPLLGKRHPEMTAAWQWVVTPLTVLCYIAKRDEIVMTNVLDSRNRRK